MFIADTHADTLSKMTEFPRPPMDITVERLQKAGTTLQTFAFFVGGSQKHDEVMRQNAKMLQALEKIKQQPITQVFDPRDAVEGKVQFMLSIEGSEIIEEDLDSLALWRERGVRMASLTWNFENSLATPANLDATSHLKPKGKEALRLMVSLGIAPDVSHLNDRGFYDILEMGLTPVASHSCARAICNHSRNLTDHQLQALFQVGGYVGVNFYPHFLTKKMPATLDSVCDHIEHMLALGGEGKIGLGSDFDGIECAPIGLESPLGVPALLETLAKRGISKEIVEGIAGNNLLCYYDRVFPKG